MTRSKQQIFIKGTAAHRRTESDYISVLLETVTLDDWQDVVAAALEAAKDGDAQSRAWLAQYLVDKSFTKAPTPLTVVVRQLNGTDPLIDQLASRVISQALYPTSYENEEWEASIKALVVAELAEKVVNTENGATSETARLPAQNSDAE